jgi:hypothetical protein
MHQMSDAMPRRRFLASQPGLMYAARMNTRVFDIGDLARLPWRFHGRLRAVPPLA